MKKIIVYFLVSTFLISQDNIEKTKDVPSNSEIQAEAKTEPKEIKSEDLFDYVGEPMGLTKFLSDVNQGQVWSF